jgi:hypothetical protein
MPDEVGASHLGRKRVVHCNKLHRYSITTAWPSSDSGSDNPSAFAVFRLMISSTVVPWMTGARLPLKGAHNSQLEIERRMQL